MGFLLVAVEGRAAALWLDMLRCRLADAGPKLHSSTSTSASVLVPCWAAFQVPMGLKFGAWVLAEQGKVYPLYGTLSHRHIPKNQVQEIHRPPYSSEVL